MSIVSIEMPEMALAMSQMVLIVPEMDVYRPDMVIRSIQLPELGLAVSEIISGCLFRIPYSLLYSLHDPIQTSLIALVTQFLPCS